MEDQQSVDHYEVLQVSPHADSETIERVFRHLAKRFHPDNTDTGNSDRFTLVVQAFRVLSDPEDRAAYDLKRESRIEGRWRVLDQESAGDNVEADRRIRLGILSILYSARRQDVERPGLGTYEIERLLECPEHHMKFHVWYLKSNGWIERLDNGQYAITATGVDRVAESDMPWRGGPLMLRDGSDPAGGSGENPTSPDGGVEDQASTVAGVRGEATMDEAESGEIGATRDGVASRT